MKTFFLHPYFSAFATSISLFLSACSYKQKADLIVHHAKVYTVDSAFSTAESFAVKEGKFIAVGTDDGIMNKYEAAETIDAQGKAVYPGFIDSHCHFYEYGKGLQEVDLVGTNSFMEVLDKLEAQKNNLKPGQWLIGRGWDQNDWDVKEFPNNNELNRLFPGNPVFIERVDGHAALVNDVALGKAHITTKTKVEGGEIMAQVVNNEPSPHKFENLLLTGILIDKAIELVKKVIPKPSIEQINASLLAAQKNCFAVGLTTIDDAGLEKKIVDAMDALQKSGELKMRVYAMLTDNKENRDYYLQHGIYKTDRLDVRSFKFYADGALGSRGACLLQPYSDKPEQRGFLLSKEAHFDSAAISIAGSKFQMNTHCIGDSAVRMIGDLYRSVLYNPVKNVSFQKAEQGKDRRWRIEHFQVITQEDIDALAAAPIGTIIPSVQPTHATSDMYWAKERLGADRIKYAYAYNDLLKAAGLLALGTDFPVENINPLYTFYAAVARKDLEGYPEGGFQPENALSRENTLRGMTIWGAYANFGEKEKGSIEAGKFADFVILDTDIMQCPIGKVPAVKVIYTFVNGENVYHR